MSKCWFGFYRKARRCAPQSKLTDSTCFQTKSNGQKRRVEDGKQDPGSDSEVEGDLVGNPS